MGVKDWIFGNKEPDLAPITIQQFEQLLMKRRGNTGNVILRIGDEEYALLKKQDYQDIKDLLTILRNQFKLTEDSR